MPAGTVSISDTIETRPSIDRAPDEGLEALRAPVRAAIRKVCPARLRHLADDIVQDVLIRLMEIRRREWGSRPFPASYLYRAAYNATVDEIRRRCNALEGPLPDDVPLEPPDRAPGPERRAASLETASAIRDCLTGLVEARRRAVTLFLEGCSVGETAAALGFTFKKASHLVYRGLADLRTCLAGKGVAP